MPLPVPNLDDRDYAQLAAKAKELIPAHCPEWTDLSPGDPGIALVEVFAYLTDAMLYRLNRIPDKAFVQFLNLVGVTLTPPAAASVELTFSIRKAQDTPVVVRRGSRVTTSRPGPVFTTMMDAIIAPGSLTATAVGLDCELTPAELLGTGTGQGGQRFMVDNPPIVLDSGDGSDLLVGVEVLPDELDERVSVIRHEGTSYRLWRETTHFGADVGDTHVFLADRAEGVISFAPAVRNVVGPNAVLLADVPPVGRAIRAWYRSGGGADGNVSAGTLTVMRDPVILPGGGSVEVTNKSAATGGRDIEKLDNALLRGPHQVNTYERVVTARDYERVAVSASGGVSRALAATRADLWAGAPGGEVEVLLVPSLDDDAALTATAEQLKARQSALVVDRVRAALADTQPMGARTRVGWAGLKKVHVRVTAVCYRAEDREAVARRLTDRLRRALTPLPVDGAPGRPFGEPLRASAIYDVLLAERGVRYVDRVRLVVDEVPGDVLSLVADPHQRETWFCSSDDKVFRSMDNADGWELVQTFPGQRVEHLAVCPGVPGALIASARVGQTEATMIQVSRDYGESWSSPAQFAFHVEGLAMGAVNKAPVAWFATDNGLFRLELAPGAVPESILVEASSPAKPFYAVEIVSAPGDDIQVAVAAQELGGVFLSFQGGRAGTFQPLGLKGVDVRLLRTQRTPGRRFLLTGAFATGDDPGAGVSRLELLPYQPSPDGWKTVGANWVGGSCRDLAPVGDRIFAATAKSAITVGDTSREGASWWPSPVDCGLPLREVGRFQPLFAVAAANNLLLSGCIGGVYSSNNGRTWQHASEQEFSERVSLPKTWLFAPGEHELTVRYDTDAR